MLVHMNSFQTNVKFPQMQNLYKTKYLIPLLLHVELTEIAPCNKETVLHRDSVSPSKNGFSII